MKLDVMTGVEKVEYRIVVEVVNRIEADMGDSSKGMEGMQAKALADGMDIEFGGGTLIQYLQTADVNIYFFLFPFPSLFPHLPLLTLFRSLDSSKYNSLSYTPN